LLFPMVGRRVRVFAQIPDGVDVIAFSTLLTDMGTVSSSFLRHLRDAAVRTAFATSRAQHLMANEIEEQNVRYRGSAIVAGNGADTKSGDFFRDGDDAPVTHALQAPDVAARVAHLAIVLPGRNGARPSFQIPEAVETVTFADPMISSQSGWALARLEASCSSAPMATSASSLRRPMSMPPTTISPA
jgi:hypothetical protein